MESKTGAAAGLSKPPAANPVMDVVSPPAEKFDKPLPENKSVDPLDELVAEAKAEQAKKPDKPSSKSLQKAQKKTGDINGNTRLAIAATIIIVLGLSALATYAYLQTSR